MLYVHNQFARDDQIPKWSDGSVVAFERQDKRENPTMTDGDLNFNPYGVAGAVPGSYSYPDTVPRIPRFSTRHTVAAGRD